MGHSDLPYFDDSDVERVLCVVAHPDDMEYGGSAAVARWTSLGIDVSYLLLTAGEAGMRSRDPEEVAPLRADEQRAACAAVGVQKLEILDLPDGTLEASPETRRHIAREIRRTRPDVVITQPWELEVGWGLNHADHRAAGLATVDAVRDADNPWVFRELAEQEGLQPWGATWLLVTNAAEPDHLIELSARDVERGARSLEAHEAYLAELGEDFDVPGMLQDMTEQYARLNRSSSTGHALAVKAYRMG